METEWHEKCEALKQRCHILKLELKAKQETVGCLTSDLEQIFITNEKEVRKELVQVHENNERKLMLLKNEKEDFLEKVADAKVKEEKLQKEISHLKSQFTEINDCSQKRDESKCPLENVSVLEEKIDTLREVNLELQQEIESKKYLLIQAEEEEKEMKQNLAEMEMLIESKTEEICRLKSSIDENNKEAEDLRVIMENAQLATVDPSQKGNSLFAELQDRKKMVAEKKKILEFACNRLEKDVESYKNNLKKTMDKMKAWNPLTENNCQFRMTDRLYQQNLVLCKKSLEKVKHLEKRFLSFTNITIPHSKDEEIIKKALHKQLTDTRDWIEKGKNRLQSENFKLAGAHDAYKKIMYEITKLENALQAEKNTNMDLLSVLNEKAETNSTQDKEKEPNVKATVRFQDENCESTILELNSGTNKVGQMNKTKRKCQVVPIKKPVLQSCEQQ